MNWVDIVIVVVWVATAFWGASIGLIQVAVHLVVVAVGLALSSRIAGVVGNLFAPVTDNEQAQTVAGFIAIFLILFIAGGIVSQMLRTVLGIIPLVGLANKLGGLAVGVVVGFVLLSGVLTGIQRFPVRDFQKTIDDSVLGALLADNFDVIIRGIKLIPSDWADEYIPSG
ncbi:MAG: CvpA family protein [Chloroflexi bacterium]|nr:CvpA family protein [Chloroflexota bacterium]